MPPALIGRWANGEEVGQSLPPYAPVEAHLVDEYPDLPEEWERSTADTACYVVGLKEGNGMWFDFTSLAYHPTHNVAVRMSMQGVCVITGVEVVGGQMPLHQYKRNCPTHNVPFGPNLRCNECGFDWPAQNYLASTAPAIMWIDGFRASDGKTRQFLITEDENRGIAAQLIGNRRTFDLTFAFFLSRATKPPAPPYRFRGGLEGALESMPHSFGAGSKGIGTGGGYGEEPVMRGLSSAGVKKLEIGAGALINQRIGADPNGIDHWADLALGRVRVYYMPVAQLAPILAAGRSRAQAGRSFVGGLKVGNPPPGVGNKTT